MIAKRDSLNEILDNLCRLVEAQAGDVLASILLLDGNRLRHGGSPSLPKAFTDAINGAVIGPSAGSCGTAAYRGQPVIVEDIATDPLWADYRDLALSHSLCACWSTPVFSSQGKVIATFAMYYREPRRPTQRDQEIIDLIAHLAGVTIQQQKAFDEIKKSEDRLRLVIDTIPALVWSSRPDGAVEYFNQPYLDYTGLSLDQAAAGWPRAFHPDDMAGMLEKWRALLEAGVRGEAEARLRRFDGAYRWFLFQTEPLRDEVGNIVKWYGLFTDIEDRKRTEEALRESDQRFRDYAETASDWHWETGPNHLITRVSDLYNVGITPSSVLGVARWEIATDVESEPEKWRLHREILDAHRPFRNFVYTQAFYDVNGTLSTVYIQTSGKPFFDADGNFLGYRGTGTDITATIRADRAEQELRKAQAALAHVTRVTTLGELTASIAHEVNQPLAAVVANAEACLRWLDRETPNLDGARRSVEWVIDDGNRESGASVRSRKRLTLRRCRSTSVTSSGRSSRWCSAS